jgi:hypothetical protein
VRESVSRSKRGPPRRRITRRRLGSLPNFGSLRTGCRRFPLLRSCVRRQAVAVRQFPSQTGQRQVGSTDLRGLAAWTLVVSALAWGDDKKTVNALINKALRLAEPPDSVMARIGSWYLGSLRRGPRGRGRPPKSTRPPSFDAIVRDKAATDCVDRWLLGCSARISGKRSNRPRGSNSFCRMFRRHNHRLILHSTSPRKNLIRRSTDTTRTSRLRRRSLFMSIDPNTQCRLPA